MIGVVVLGTCAFLGSCLCACCKTETAGGCCKMGAMTLCVFIIVALSKFFDYHRSTTYKWSPQKIFMAYNDVYNSDKYLLK